MLCCKRLKIRPNVVSRFFSTNKSYHLQLNTVYTSHLPFDLYRTKQGKNKKFSDHVLRTPLMENVSSFHGLSVNLTEHLPGYLMKLCRGTSLPTELGVVWTPRLNPMSSLKHPPMIQPVSKNDVVVVSKPHDLHMTIVPVIDGLSLDKFILLLQGLPWDELSNAGPSQASISPRHSAAGPVGLVLDALHNYIAKYLPQANENADLAQDLSDVIFFLENIYKQHMANCHNIILSLVEPGTKQFPISDAVAQALKEDYDRLMEKDEGEAYMDADTLQYLLKHRLVAV